MKRTLTLIVAGLLGVVLAAQPYEPVNPNATPEAKALLADLYQTVAEGKIISVKRSYPEISKVLEEYLDRKED